MKKSSSIALALLSLAATAASAQTYVGISAGATHFSADCTGVTCDKTDAGYKLYGGYKFGGGWAGEVSYVDYGKLKAAAVVSGSSVSASIKGSGFGIGAAYLTDFSPVVSGSLRLGVATNRSRVDTASGSLSSSDSERSTQPYFGLGVGYKLSPAATLELAYESTRFKYSGEKSTVGMLSLGLVYGF